MIKSNQLLPFLAIVIFTTGLNAQDEEIIKARTEITELLKKESRVSKTLDKDDVDYDKDVRYSWGTHENISVLEDRIEFRRRKEFTAFYFSELNNYDISFTTDQKNNGGAILGEFLIMLDGKENGKKLADNLNFLKNQILIARREKEYGPQLIQFEPVAAKYRELKVKPQISEEQRKYIVQANSFNELRDFNKAIELYIKAIEIDQTSYPAAYSNLALLSAQIFKYDAAIYYMKKYLLLEPQASDARSAQDKVYIWESKLGL